MVTFGTVSPTTIVRGGVAAENAPSLTVNTTE